jgi:hypothetical protein
MSRLVALYPRAWRDRYEVEFLALMADRSQTPRDRFDVLRGAVDARLHPQLRPSPSVEPDRGRTLPVGAALAVLAGVLWMATGLSFAGSPIDPYLGYKQTDWGGLLAVGGALFAGLTGIVVTPDLPGRHRMASIAAMTAVCGALGMLLPWPIWALGFFAAIIGGIGFGIATVSRLAGSGILLAVACVVALGFNTEDSRALLLVPLGLAWIGVGIVLAVRPPTEPADSQPVGG